VQEKTAQDIAAVQQGLGSQVTGLGSQVTGLGSQVTGLGEQLAQQQKQSNVIGLLSMLGMFGGAGQQPVVQAPEYEYADIGEITPFEEFFTPYSTSSSSSTRTRG
jgi:hypothetical protein